MAHQFSSLVIQPVPKPEITAKVAELVDALDLGSSGATRGSSSLPFRTNSEMRP